MDSGDSGATSLDLDSPEWAVTVCVTHHNRPEKLRRALEQLRDVSAVPLTVRVHENGSTQDVDAALSELIDEELIDELIRTDENLGIAGSRHLLLDADDIETDYVLVLDDDMYVSDGWDQALLSVFAADPEIGIVGAPFMIPGYGGIRDGGQVFTWTDGYPGIDSERKVLRRDAADYSSIADPDTAYRIVDDVPMGSSLLRRETLVDVSLPDRQTFEDIAFSLDVANAGWRTAMSCEVLFYHDKRTENETNRTRTDWNAKREGYREFRQRRGLRFPLKEHLLHEVVFAIPNLALWAIADVKNRRVF